MSNMYHVHMKPCDLTENNWDVDVAVLDLGDTEVRVWAGCTGIGFISQSSILSAEVSMPITTWKKIVDFVENFKIEDLDEDQQITFFPDKKHEVVIINGLVKRNWKNHTQKVVKYPLSIMIGQWPHSMNQWQIQLRMSKLKKIVKWYNTDV